MLDPDLCRDDGRLHEVAEASDGGVNVFRVDDVFLLVEPHMRIAALPLERVVWRVSNIAHDSYTPVVRCVELSEVLQKKFQNLITP